MWSAKIREFYAYYVHINKGTVRIHAKIITIFKHMKIGILREGKVPVDIALTNIDVTFAWGVCDKTQPVMS